MADERRLDADIKWGLGIGASVGVAFTLFFGVIPSLLRRSTYFPSYDIYLGELTVVYIVGGLVIGFVMGLMRPLTKTRRGCALVGLASGPPTAVIGLVWMGELATFPLNVIFIAFWTLIYMPAMGVAAWYGDRRVRGIEESLRHPKSRLSEAHMSVVDEVLSEIEDTTAGEKRG